MSALTARQRGDLAEEMLPVAANLAVLVHGDGGPQDVAQVLEGLDQRQKDALIVVLAGLVDPEQPVGKALGWLDFNEHGALTVPSWSEDRSVRDLAPDGVEDLGEDYVDEVAVQRFVRGLPLDTVTDAEFLTAVQHCVAMGMSTRDIDALRKWTQNTAENWINKLRKQYQRSGREFPELTGVRKMPEDVVVAIRERAADGATYLELAMSYGTNAGTISEICRGRTYKQFGGPIRKPKKKPSRNSRTVWSDSTPGFLDLEQVS
ncbi:hypothetical protein [Streptomyces cylindrosporus]|uniref:Uncharacterized protein n=1 Tax=Streptomyces cylindrosporus TaxID=2927583 RepID=A0ABS9YPG0_9ACTN|nr:hypothetical protein [Streptomyces cylindrosporus]MCI3279163.1 hypothetical protein [Streptomyces cylindrosporus]